MLQLYVRTILQYFSTTFFSKKITEFWVVAEQNLAKRARSLFRSISVIY